jgi:para-nitrobenzyl esterase
LGGLLLLTLACGETRPEADVATRRSLAAGEIVGASLSQGALHAWRGIPYAEAPVGSLRWQPPRPPKPWTGRFEALESGSPCAQLGGDPILGSEDCLYLDVYAPPMASEAVPRGSERKPVLFWIHGGGNTMGYGNQIPPQRLAAEHDVLVVMINYRLGVFGWLSHPALRASAPGPEAASGNFGTLDLIRGLEWVRDQIAGFGGDPNRVTIFGESAGGVDVYSLLLSPRAKGLFHTAISQSGMARTVTRVEAEGFTDAEEAGAMGLPGSSGELLLALLQQTGRAEDRAEAKSRVAAMSEKETEAFLRGLSTEAILQPFAEALGDGPMPMYGAPTVIRDGVVIPDVDPIEAFSTPGGYNAVPFIAGTNRDESKLFLAMISPHVSRTFGLPTGYENERLYDVEAEYGALAWRLQGVDEPLEAMRSVQGPSVWAYRFDWDEEGSVLGVDLSELIGAAHAVELLFVFGLTDLGFVGNRIVFEDRNSAEQLSRQMRAYWTNFARTLRPGRGGREDELPEWQPWNPEPGASKYLIFDSAEDGGLRLASDRLDRAFLIDRALNDPRLFDSAERCRVLGQMVQWGRVLSPEAYREIGEGVCRAHPLEPRSTFGSLSHHREASSGGAR